MAIVRGNLGPQWKFSARIDIGRGRAFVARTMHECGGSSLPRIAHRYRCDTFTTTLCHNIPRPNGRPHLGSMALISIETKNCNAERENGIVTSEEHRGTGGR